MAKRFFALLSQDIKVTVRSYFHYAVLFLAVMMILVINYLIPERVEINPATVFYDDAAGKYISKMLLASGAEAQVLESLEELNEAVEKNRAIGVIVGGTFEDIRFTIKHQGNESQETLNLLKVGLDDMVNAIRREEPEYLSNIKYLRPRVEPVPFNKSMVPLMIVLEAVMLGLMLVAFMVFQEKEEGGVKAYRVSPGGTFVYILSKIVVNVLLAVLYSALVIFFTLGFSISFLNGFVIIILASFLMTLVGLSVSVFFRNIEEFLFVGVFITALLGLPMVSYFNPSFAPAFLTWMPSYPVMFGLREIFFPTGKEGFLMTLNLTLVIQCIGFLIISYLTVSRKLMKEGK